MRNATVVLAVLAVVAMAAPAYGGNCEFNVGSGAWGTNTNWNGGAGNAPLSGDDVWIVNGNTASITTEAAVGNTMYVGNTWYASPNGTINISGGSLTVGNALWMGFDGGSNAATGTIIQSGGDVSIAITAIGSDADNSSGHYTISGGSFDGGALLVGSPGYPGNGWLTVNGTAPSSVNASSSIGVYGSKLEFILGAGSAGVTKITAAALNSWNPVLSGTISVTDTGHTMVLDEVIDVLQVGGVTMSSYVGNFTIDNTNWELQTTGDTLQIKSLVPEPATMCLLGIGGIGVLIRRRRR